MNRRFALLAVLVALSGCETKVTADFSAKGVTANGASGASAGLARNDPFVVAFSAPLDERAFPSDALRVTTREGRRLATRAFVRHDALYVEAADAEGWPENAELLIEIPFPPLGPPIRSKSGRLLSRSFSATAAVGSAYATKTGPLRVVAKDLDLGVRGATQDASFRFVADGPVDPETLAGAFVVYDAERRDDRRVAFARLVSSDEIVVTPFALGGFKGGAVFTLEIAPVLAAKDGRSVRAGAAWRFSTAKGPSGEHRTDFRAADLESPELNGDGGPLEPTRRPVVAVASPGVVEAAPYAFGAGPFRVQARIPSEALGDDDVLIERLAIPVANGGRAATVVRSLSVRMGDAADAPGRALDEAFDDNWRAGSTPLLIDGLGAEGAFVARVDWDGKIEIVFSTPYVHRALDPSGYPRDLLIELVAGDAPSSDAPIFPLLGRRFGDGATRCVASADLASTRGLRCDVVPAIEVGGWRHPPVVLKPWTTDLPSPRYVERPDAVFAVGRAFDDFTIEYRALDAPAVLGGAHLPSTPWSPRLSALQGRAHVQARVVFHPKPAHAGRVSPSIERLSLPFVEGP
jgi:hypothetical protein